MAQHAYSSKFSSLNHMLNLLNFLIDNNNRLRALPCASSNLEYHTLTISHSLSCQLSFRVSETQSVKCHHSYFNAMSRSISCTRIVNGGMKTSCNNSLAFPISSNGINRLGWTFKALQVLKYSLGRSLQESTLRKMTRSSTPWSLIQYHL